MLPLQRLPTLSLSGNIDPELIRDTGSHKLVHSMCACSARFASRAPAVVSNKQKKRTRNEEERNDRLPKIESFDKFHKFPKRENSIRRHTPLRRTDVPTATTTTAAVGQKNANSSVKFTSAVNFTPPVRK